MSLVWKEGYDIKDADTRNPAVYSTRKTKVVPISGNVAKPSNALPDGVEDSILNKDYKALNPYLKKVVAWFHAVHDHRKHYSNLTIHTFQVKSGTNYEELSDYCQGYFKKHGFLTMRVNNPTINLVGILVKKRR